MFADCEFADVTTITRNRRKNSGTCKGKNLRAVICQFKIDGQIIHTVKYADDLVLQAKEEKVLQDMIDKLIEIGRCYGMEMNVEKTKVMRISRPTITSKNYDRPKTNRECGIF
jgi:hypothetical protein